MAKFKESEYVAVLSRGKHFVGHVVDVLETLEGVFYNVAFVPGLPLVECAEKRLDRASVIVTPDAKVEPNGEPEYAKSCDCADCRAQDALRLPGFYVVRKINDIPTATHRRPFNSLRVASAKADEENFAREAGVWYYTMWWDGTGFLEHKPA